MVFFCNNIYFLYMGNNFCCNTLCLGVNDRGVIFIENIGKFRTNGDIPFCFCREARYCGLIFIDTEGENVKASLG
jgi:hypothetical protein